MATLGESAEDLARVFQQNYTKPVYGRVPPEDRLSNPLSAIGSSDTNVEATYSGDFILRDDQYQVLPKDPLEDDEEKRLEQKISPVEEEARELFNQGLARANNAGDTDELPTVDSDSILLKEDSIEVSESSTARATAEHRLYKVRNTVATASSPARRALEHIIGKGEDESKRLLADDPKTGEIKRELIRSTIAVNLAPFMEDRKYIRAVTGDEMPRFLSEEQRRAIEDVLVRSIYASGDLREPTEAEDERGSETSSLLRDTVSLINAIGQIYQVNSQEERTEDIRDVGTDEVEEPVKEEDSTQEIEDHQKQETSFHEGDTEDTMAVNKNGPEDDRVLAVSGQDSKENMAEESHLDFFGMQKIPRHIFRKAISFLIDNERMLAWLDSGLLSEEMIHNIKRRLPESLKSADLRKLAGQDSESFRQLQSAFIGACRSKYPVLTQVEKVEGLTDFTVAKLTSRAMQENLRDHRFQLKSQALQGKDIKTKLAATSDLEDFFTQIDDYVKEFEEGCLTIDPLKIEWLDDTPLFSFSEEKGQWQSTTRNDLTTIAFPGSYDTRVRFVKGIMTPVVDSGERIRHYPIPKLILDALEALEEKSAETLMFSGKRGVRKEDLPEALETLCGTLGVKFDESIVEEVISIGKRSPFGGILAQDIFDTVMSRAEKEGVVDIFSSFSGNSKALACFVGTAGSFLERLDQLPPEVSQRILEFASYDRLSLEDMERVVTMGERETLRRNATETSEEKGKLPTVGEIVAQVKDDFTGQEQAVEPLVSYILKVFQQMRERTGVAELDRRDGSNEISETKVMVLSGPTGSGKSSAFEQIKKRAGCFDELDICEVNIAGTVREGIVGNRIRDLFAKGIEEVAQRRGISFEEAKKRAEIGQVIFIFDEAERAIVKPTDEGELAKADQSLGTELRGVLDTRHNRITLQEKDGSSYIDLGEIDTRFVPCVLASSLSVAGQKALQIEEMAKSKDSVARLSDNWLPLTRGVAEDVLAEDLPRRIHDWAHFIPVTKDMLTETWNNSRSARCPQTTLRNSITKIYKDYHHGVAPFSEVHIKDEAAKAIIDHASGFVKKEGYSSLTNTVHDVYDYIFRKNGTDQAKSWIQDGKFVVTEEMVREALRS